VHGVMALRKQRKSAGSFSGMRVISLRTCVMIANFGGNAACTAFEVIVDRSHGNVRTLGDRLGSSVSEASNREKRARSVEDAAPSNFSVCAGFACAPLSSPSRLRFCALSWRL